MAMRERKIHKDAKLRSSSSGKDIDRPSNPGSDLLETDRLVAFIDGVFAVALTILVLDLKLPTANGDLARALWGMLPQFLVYLIVFASIAGHWTIHHRTFHHVRFADGRLVLLSLINLLFVTLFPVAESITGAYPLNPLATACLSANSLFYCLSAWAIWSHVVKNPRLLEDGTDPRRIQRIGRIMSLVAGGLALAIPLAFLNVAFPYGIWVFWPAVSAQLVRIRSTPTG
jgi:uncharacterized membrane protein